jgi:hypothetical protein
MNFKILRLRSRFCILAIFGLSLFAWDLSAQVTTSSLVGSVRDDQEPLIGATVLAVHEPSGTQYGTSVSASGGFSINNMRIGGPYKITVSFIGYNPKVYSDILLRLGEPYVLNVVLDAGETALSEVVVRAVGGTDADKTGTITNIGRNQIQTMPTVTRSLNDLTRITPQANGSSIGGGNYRQNNFTIDGADFNNNFGIGDNLPANGSPISLDAIDEISVSVTPFDVRQAGFIGAAINAVTRSGTNQFQGSAYRYWRSEKQQGNRVDGVEVRRTPFNFEQIGFRLGGPIVKNKLFFFVNFETENQPKQIQTSVAATAASGPGSFGSANNNINRPLASELDEISAYLKDKYGYVTGPYQGYSTQIETKKYLARIDWNINSKHRMNVRYSKVVSNNPSNPSNSTSGTGYTIGSNLNRLSNNAMWFKNSMYYQGANFTSIAGELNSQFGKFSNVLRATFTDQDDSRSSDSQEFPFVDIMKDDAVFTSFGYELFSKGNIRQVKTYSALNNLTWNSGKHSWLVGAQADVSRTTNGFQRFATSYYRFASWDDFVTGQNPTDFAQTHSLFPGFAQAFPSFKFAQLSAYVQDEISFNHKFKLTLGIRAELPTYPNVDEIMTHPLISNLTFNGGTKVNTGNLPKATVMLSPRAGFSYDVFGDRSLQLRGGSGIFTGRLPFVWIVSQSGDAGMLQTTFNLNGKENTPGPFNPNPNAYLPAVPPVAGTFIPGTINAMSEGFRFPQTWKTGFGFDKKLPENFVFSFDAILNKDINAVAFRNVNLVDPQALNIEGYADNRLVYPSSVSKKYINPLNRDGQAVETGDASGTGAFNTTLIENTKKGGYYFSLSGKLEKNFSKGLYGFLAYTYSNSKNLSDGSGDQLLGAWQQIQNVNGGNRPVLAPAAYVLPHRVNGMVSYRAEYLKAGATTLTLMYNGAAQGRYSYVYSSDFNNDGVNANDLIYVPKDASEISFVNNTINGVEYSAQQQSDAFFQFIEQDKYLSKRKGKYAERNGAVLPWRNQFDLKLMQDVFFHVANSKHTVQFTLDIFNFGNLLNSKWGVFKSTNVPSVLALSNASEVTPGGTTHPTFRTVADRNKLPVESFRNNESITSTYYMQFGIRYLFN